MVSEAILPRGQTEKRTQKRETALDTINTTVVSRDYFCLEQPARSAATQNHTQRADKNLRFI